MLLPHSFYLSFSYLQGTKLFLTEKYDDASFFFNLVINLIKSGKNVSTSFTSVIFNWGSPKP